MTDKAEISEEASARICAHMNDDHAATLHAVVLSRLSSREAARCKVQNAKMKSVSLEGYSISYVLCDGDACAMKTVDIPFDPPLASSDEVRPRLVEDHHKALAPKFSWLVTDPFIGALFGGHLLLIGAGVAMGEEELSNRVDGNPLAGSVVTTVFGTSTLFAKLIMGAFYFCVVTLPLEAIYTTYLCKTRLKMETGTAIKWFVLNVCVGYPIMNKVKELVAVDDSARAKAEGPRLVKDNDKALAPKFSWLVTDPLMRTLFGACLLLGAGVALGPEELAKRVDETPLAASIVTTVFGTSALFAKLVVGAFYFSLVAHTLEAIYTIYLCKMRLKMETGTSIKWFVLNVCTGFPIMNKVKELVAADDAARAKAKDR